MGYRDEEEEEGFGKHWANDYILGPLHDLEPSQEAACRIKPLPTPPTSASPSRSNFPRSHSRQTSQNITKKDPFSSPEDDDSDTENQPFLTRLLSRTNSVNRRNSVNKRNGSVSQRVPPGVSLSSPPDSPSRPPNSSRDSPTPPLTLLERKRSVHTSRPPLTHWNQGTILSRSNSVSSRPVQRESNPAVDTKPKPIRRTGSLSARFPGDQSHRPLSILTHEHMASQSQPRGQQAEAPLRRGQSLRERHPGDMTARPLDMIKRDRKLAERQPRLHNHHKKQPSDVIDSLDLTGLAVYHHDGPYDAASQSRNRDKRYAPLEAVKDSNREALKATPHEFIQDSLTKKVPLQGTAVIPPGMPDLHGREMEYKEGSDMMRDRAAPGGAYKRWDGIHYLDEDLKGKGEPSYTFEKERREQKARLKLALSPPGSANGRPSVYEMRPGVNRSQSHTYTRASGYGNGPDGKESGTHVRQRSVSNATPSAAFTRDRLSPEFLQVPGAEDGGGGVRRSNSTTGRAIQSIKSAFGSMRRRKVNETAA